MKKIHILLVVGLLTLATSGGMVNAASVYLDYGVNGTGKSEAETFGNQTYSYEAQEFTPIAAGIIFSLYNLKLGVDYQSGMDPDYASNLTNEVMAAESDTILGNLGIRLLNREHFQLWLNGFYLNDKFELNGNNSNGLIKYSTAAYLVGPEFNWKITNKLNLQGYCGFATSANQKINTVAHGDLDSVDISVLLYNIKLNYAITDHLAVGVGYRAKELHSTLDFATFDVEFNNTQRTATAGVTFKF
jgi:hypothetical protein